MGKRLWSMAAVAVLAAFACGGTPAPPASSGGGAQQDVGKVAFLSSQGQPAQEVQDMNDKVLPGFKGSVDFNSQSTEPQMTDKVLAQAKAGQGSIDVLGMTQGGFASLQAADALEDLTPLVQKLQKDRKLNSSLTTYGKLGTQKQYFIPWMVATYMLVVNNKATQYLPKGADVNALTYDQLITWGENIQKAKGERLIGLPAAPGTKGGLLNRFLQGYTYPAYTGTEITNFKSPEAVQMWQMLRRLWAVTNPQSTTYAYMQDPLENGEVWIAFDHQARFKDAMAKMGDQFKLVPAPSGPRGLSYLTAVIGLAIPKNAPNKAGAEALIDWLTTAKPQAAASQALSFSSVLEGLNVSNAPAYVTAESNIATKYTTNKHAIAAQLEVGLGTQGDALKLAYQDAFTRIILRNEDISAALAYESAQIQQALNTAKAPCWPPDPPSTGPCQIK
jgi:multiple sugar transport system substrate-binding protein